MEKELDERAVELISYGEAPVGDTPAQRWDSGLSRRTNTFHRDAATKHQAFRWQICCSFEEDFSRSICQRR